MGPQYFKSQKRESEDIEYTAPSMSGDAPRPNPKHKTVQKQTRRLCCRRCQ